jgi:hypothetical protein
MCKATAEPQKLGAATWWCSRTWPSRIRGLRGALEDFVRKAEKPRAEVFVNVSRVEDGHDLRRVHGEGVRGSRGRSGINIYEGIVLHQVEGV